MKLRLAPVIVLWCATLSIARADDEPLHDTPAITKAQGWMKAMLAPGGAVAAPSKEQPLEYLVINSIKACKAMKSGTAKDFKVAAKLKTCVVAAYKAISSAPIEAQWSELRDEDLPGLYSAFPPAHTKQLQAGAKGAKVVSAHYPGDGKNMDAFLVVADGRIRALWLREEAFE